MKDILYEIGTIARALDSISNMEFKEQSLTKGQYLYVVRIYEHPGIILENLADMLKVDKTTASRAVQKLEEKGIIERKMQTNNKKNKQLYVTEKGAALYVFVMKEHQYSAQVALQQFTEDETHQLLALLQKVRLNIEHDWEFVKKGGKRQY